jgi:hypothetical protein
MLLVGCGNFTQAKNMIITTKLLYKHKLKYRINMENRNENATKIGFLEWLAKIKNIHYSDDDSVSRALEKIN